MKTQQSGHVPRFGPKVKDGALKKLRCGTIQVSCILWMISAGAARILPLYLA